MPGSHLACGRDHEVQAINGDVDSDAHACEAEVALPQDGEKGFAGSLVGDRSIVVTLPFQRAFMGWRRHRVPNTPGSALGSAIAICP